MAKDINREYYIGYADGFPEVKDGQVLYDSYGNKLYIDIDNERKQVNQQSNWNETNESSPAFIQNKPDIKIAESLEDEDKIATVGILKPCWNIIKRIPTWDEIIIENNYHNYELGMEVPLDFGTYGVHSMVLVAFDSDDKTGLSQKTRTTWISKDAITTSTHNTTSNDSSDLYWDYSVIRQQVLPNIKSQLPQNVQSAILSVDKSTKVNDTNNSQSVDYLWIPSSREIFGEDGGIESVGPVYYYMSNSVKNRKKGETWWLRTQGSTNGNFIAVLEDGSMGEVEYSEENGVVVGFCLGMLGGDV